MPRRARIVLSGYLYHVIQRGNYRQDVFDEDQDRVTYLKYVQECSQKYGANIYAYCLMDNHVHFIVKPWALDSLGKMFSVAHMKYAHYYNKKRGARGHLWQGRFYSCLLVGSHVREAVRYVECNPVRANMVERAWDYSWSSARAHLGKVYKIISLADISEYIDVSSWREYLTGQEDEEFIEGIRMKTRKGLVLATEEVVKSLEIKLKRRIIFNLPGRPRRCSN